MKPVDGPARPIFRKNRKLGRNKRSTLNFAEGTDPLKDYLNLLDKNIFRFLKKGRFFVLFSRETFPAKN